MSVLILKSNRLCSAEERKYNAFNEFYCDQTECPICQNALEIQTEKIEYGSIKEEARCSQCKALKRVEAHTLH